METYTTYYRYIVCYYTFITGIFINGKSVLPIVDYLYSYRFLQTTHLAPFGEKVQYNYTGAVYCDCTVAPQGITARL